MPSGRLEMFAPAKLFFSLRISSLPFLIMPTTSSRQLGVIFFLEQKKTLRYVTPGYRIYADISEGLVRRLSIETKIKGFARTLAYTGGAASTLKPVKRTNVDDVSYSLKK